MSPNANFDLSIAIPHFNRSSRAVTGKNSREIEVFYSYLDFRFAEKAYGLKFDKCCKNLREVLVRVGHYGCGVKPIVVDNKLTGFISFSYYDTVFIRSDETWRKTNSMQDSRLHMRARTSL